MSAGAEAVDARIVDLEVRIAFQEKLIGELDDVIRGLRTDFEALVLEVERLRTAIEADRGVVIDERPPHY